MANIPSCASGAATVMEKVFHALDILEATPVSRKGVYHGNQGDFSRPVSDSRCVSACGA